MPGAGGEIEMVIAGEPEASGLDGTGAVGPGNGGADCVEVIGGDPAEGGMPGLGKGRLVIDGKGFCGLVDTGGGVTAGGAETDGVVVGCDNVFVFNGGFGVEGAGAVAPMGTPRLTVGGIGHEDPMAGAEPAGEKLPSGPVGTPGPLGN